ncbi:hypothetical protein [Actinomadura decatromicini]|uniref:DUF5666 domain-containing protein n=1 Tax=Actinomadura decatromicini TaxID=2604572 RepID=A0A5D3FW03_9ACTN|nr:hypothetical protein [Actinomadura decatromicini]TYK53037.1 hypothetical protein FXF68_04690 [Actinomadura decatromicini]
MAVRRPVRPSDAPADDPEDVLSSSPFEDDVQTALDAAPRERPRPSLTLVLVGGLLLAAGFVGGIEANKRWGPDGSSPGPAAVGARNGTGGGLPGGGPAAGYPGGRGAGPGGTAGGGSQGGAPQGGGQGGSQGGMTVGTVKLVSGDTVYVQTLDGGLVTVETSGSTKIQISRAGKASDLKPGSTVSVQGSSGSSGKISATAITQGSRPGN